ncbi:MAG: response regulator transcription factor [Parasporobacterium sp.]|nr:response regulator transcription factor [Parasporobacterium sp.]
MRLLIVEDEREIADGMKTVLSRENYLVDVVYDGLSGLDYIFSNLYDLVLLDIMLPKLSGLDILKNIREAGIDVPVILVTAKSQTEDKVTGLDMGADDYLTKPFDAAELLARIRARTRSARNTNQNIIEYGDLSIDKSTQKISCRDESIKLGKKEYQLMEYLMANPEQILTRDMLINKVWGPSDESEYNNIEVYISFLRKKLRFLKSEVTIVTTKSVGYSLEK